MKNLNEKKEFKLTLRFVSARLPSWLASEVTNDLLYRQQALFKMVDYVEGEEGVGFQFNVKEPLDVAEKLPPTKYGQAKISNLGKNFYLYLSQETCKKFREQKDEVAKIPCSYEKGWLRLYFLRKHRLPTLDSVFKP